MDTHLVELIRQQSSPLEPISPESRPDDRIGINKVRAVLFDVYGTLFISGSGDISLASQIDGESHMRSALNRFGARPTSREFTYQKHFLDVIHTTRTSMIDAGIPYPEVDLRELWESWIANLVRDNRLTVDAEEVDTRAIAIAYECAVNPVWPMPGARDILHSFKDRGIRLGIVSNAQFFTPLLFKALLGLSVEEFGFETSLCAWSYEKQIGKPEPALYRDPIHQLEQDGIQKSEILMVGNDMLNDVFAAHQCGIQTALFTGDGRSLRLRNDHQGCQSMEPNHVISELCQLGETS